MTGQQGRVGVAVAVAVAVAWEITRRVKQQHRTQGMVSLPRGQKDFAAEGGQTV